MRATALLVLLAAGGLPALAIDAAAARRYALERLSVRNLGAGAERLRTELDAEVTRFLDFAARNGRPGPAYFEIGITGSWMLYGNPGETAYVMSLALPYLRPETQARVRSFLSAMVRSADPTEVAFEHCGGWGACDLAPPRREFHLLPMPPNPDPIRPNIWPPVQVPPEAIYMLWQYAEATGDWDFISTTRPPSGARWQRLRNLFQAIPAQPQRYGEVAGAIGWIRMLEKFGLTGDPTYAAALEKVRAGLTAGANFSAFMDGAFARFIGERRHDWAFLPFHFHRDNNAVGVFFAPEIGRFLAENSLADVRRRVTENPREGQPGEPRAIEAHWPYWYLYRGEYPPIQMWTWHYGENHMVTPDTPWALFMIHAYVYNEPGAVLEQYVDAPYVIGDLCHWHRLIGAIEGFGEKRWEPLGGASPPANQPPVVALTAPANGATFIAPATVEMTATASDPDGSVTRVEFLVNGAVAATVSAPPYRAQVTLATAGSYTLAARATDNQGATATSATVTVTVQAPPDTTPPSAPQGLTATALSSSSVRLAWRASTDNVGVAGYEIERNGAVLSQTVQSTEYTDTGLAAATSYAYRVRAFDAAGNRSPWSAAATVTTPPASGGDTPPPPPVKNLLVNGGFETGNLQGWGLDWGLAVAPEAAHTGRYGVKMSEGGRITQVFRTVSGRRYYVMARVRVDRVIARPSWGGVRVQITNFSNWTELAQKTLSPEQEASGRWVRLDFSFVARSSQTRIAFENFSGGGRYEASADEFYVSETTIPPDGAPPANQPPNVTLTSPANGATFLAPASFEMTATASDPDGSVARVEFLINGNVAGTATAAPYRYRVTLTGVGTYTLAARAVDDKGAQATSAPVTVTVQAAPDTTPPTTPQSLTAAAESATSVRLRWQASTDETRLAGYEVERNGTVITATPVTATEFLDTGLTALTSYTYRVRAVDGAGNRSAWSAPATATTPAAGGPVTNLLINGGLETGDFTGWYHDWGFTVVAAAAHTGRYGLKMNGDGSITQVFRTVPGRRYYAMARVRIDRELQRPSWGGLRVNITSWDWTELAAAFVTAQDTPVGQWKRLDLAFVARSDETRLNFSNFSGGGRYEASADEFYVSETPIPPDDTPAPPPQPPPNQPPVVTLTSPANGASFVAPATFDMTATASDPDGSIVRVEFLINGAVAGVATAAPYRYQATLPSAGAYTLAARAYDNQGASATSATVTVTVQAPPNQPPVVTLTAPANGSTFVAPATFDMTATAADPDGSVARVEFLINGSVTGVVTAAPYRYRATLPNAGSYTLAARAVDDRGAQTTSAPVGITVTAPPGGGGGTPSTNLLVNPGFETGNLNGWSGSAVVTGEDRYSGQWSARITTDSITQVIPTTPGESYKLTGWARITAQSGADWGGFRFEALSWDWKTLAHSGFITRDGAGPDWVKYALTFTATTSQTRIHVGFFGGPGLRMTVYVDDLAVVRRTGSGLPPELTATIEVREAPGGERLMEYRLRGDDPDGAIVRVNWDFGDGGRSQWPSGTRRVGVPGAYTAVLRASDDDGNVVTRVVPWSVPAPAGAPRIVVTEPAEGATVGSESLLVRGTAEGSLAALLVSTDRGEMAAGSPSGSWSVSLRLRPGWNRILAQVRDSQGRVAAAERRVRYVPAGPLSVTEIRESGGAERWEPYVIRFRVSNSAATHPHLPYDPNPPRGLEWVDGASVDVLFTRDNWATVLRRPAFLEQRYQRALKSNEEWMYPEGEPEWTVRFAPPESGVWRYRIEVREARGAAQSPERSFTVAPPSSAENRGPVRVSATDWRYFEYADGTPFLGGGSGIGAGPRRFSFEMIEKLNQVGAGNQKMFRWWISGQIWGSAWGPWSSRMLPYEGTVPATGLSLESAYGHGLAALELNERNPLMFYGFSSSLPSLVPGRRYRVVVRWRTEGVTGPRTAGQPYGVCVKFTGWPEPGQTSSWPVLIPHVAGHTPWHVAYGDFTATTDVSEYLSLILENATGGRAFVDEVALYELKADGTLGPQLLQSPQFNSHLTFDPRRSAALDAILDVARQLGITLRLVISEKQEYLLNHLGPEGLADRNPGNFNNGPGTAGGWLHEAYWRYLFARYGAFRSVHSWELVNEEAPGPGAHFRLTARLATLAAADGNPHPATTSTWATFAEEAWKHPDSAPISNVDFHVYVRAGWIEPREELANDSARFFAEYDRASLRMNWGKPATWGEQGINGPGSTDDEDPGLRQDRNGVWLHKMIWARCGPGGVYPLYWWTDNIFDYRLHRLYGNWNRFMAGVPLNNGRYRDAEARTSHADLRVFGQKDTAGGRAHLWMDNRRHTWRAVVDGAAVPAVSGTVTVAMGAAGASYSAVWYDTSTGNPARTETVQANAAGEVTLTVNGLATDTAVKLERR